MRILSASIVVLLVPIPLFAEDEPCPKPSKPVPLWSGGARDKWRIDPSILLLATRATFDDPPEGKEIDPFKNGTVDVDVRLAGIEIARVFGNDTFRIGANSSLGIGKHEDYGLLMISVSPFFQVQNYYRIEAGVMHARTGSNKRTGPEADKTAYFVGVSFPVISDSVRQLLGKFK
ncbi:MAG: hypothetical protein OXN89_10805 [Bryobacterales bacterium]|nr:hypothetical protein [Bryobacterales bacterium]